MQESARTRNRLILTFPDRPSRESAHVFPVVLKTFVEPDNAPPPPCYSFRWVQEEPSRWSTSGVKRFVDVAFVLVSLPLLLPVCIAIALAVHFTSPGPVLFLQQRMGRHGQIFTILKFRTLTDTAHGTHPALTTERGQQFTPIGRFLRRSKLDELPQIVNVLRGEMSLVGARPKPAEHQIADLKCRPGITGAATVAFADEGAVLARLPESAVETYFHRVMLPIKWRLDAEYMARATFGSDLCLIVSSILRRWNKSVLRRSAPQESFGAEIARSRSGSEVCLASERTEGNVGNRLCVSCLCAAPWPAQHCAERPC